MDSWSAAIMLFSVMDGHDCADTMRMFVNGITAYPEHRL